MHACTTRGEPSVCARTRAHGHARAWMQRITCNYRPCHLPCLVPVLCARGALSLMERLRHAWRKRREHAEYADNETLQALASVTWPSYNVDQQRREILGGWQPPSPRRRVPTTRRVTSSRLIDRSIDIHIHVHVDYLCSSFAYEDGILN